MKTEDFKPNTRLLIKIPISVVYSSTLSKLVLETTKSGYVYLQNDTDRNKNWYAPDDYKSWELIEVLESEKDK